MTLWSIVICQLSVVNRMVIAHRGYHQNCRENTLAAFEAAFRVKADAIECDVRLTRDNGVVISHDDEICLQGKNLIISQASLSEILEQRGQGSERLLTLDELFEYIGQNAGIFFIELKSDALLLIQSVVEKIKKGDLWGRVYVIGFRSRIKTALALQKDYPALRVAQILMFPFLSLFKLPPKSYAVFFGWLKSVRGSELVFRALLFGNLLARLRARFAKHGFEVMAGVINDPADWESFINVGITEIFTDNVPALVERLKKV